MKDKIEQTKSGFSTPLHSASFHGDYKRVLELKKHPVDFSEQLLTRDESKHFPLDKACLKGHYDIVKLLIQSQEELGLRYVSYFLLQQTVQQYLFVLTHVENLLYSFNTKTNFHSHYMNIIKLLSKKYPEQVNKVDDKGCNALFYAVSFFADACTMANKSNTTSGVNAFKQARALLKMLIESGAHVYSKDHTVKSAMDLAKRRGIGIHLTNLVTEIEMQKQHYLKRSLFFNAKKSHSAPQYAAIYKEQTNKKQEDNWPYAYYESLIFKTPIEQSMTETSFVNACFNFSQ